MTTPEKALAQPTLGPFQQLLKSRIVWLNKDVNDDNMAEISANLLLLSAQDPEADITLIINSPGGSVTAGLLLYDTINLIPNDVVTLGMGMCASMGQFLLTIGAPGKRFITPNARVLMHQPLGGIGGVATDISIQADLILQMKEQLAKVTAARTGKSLEQIHIDGDRDRWFTAQEALEYGFVDHLVTNLNEINTILNPVKKGTKKK